MPSLKLSNLFRRDAAPTLRKRAVSLRAQLSAYVAKPHPVGVGLPREAPEHNEAVTEPDAELLRLGRLFETASARERAANEACNAAQREADRHMPARPACLTYRASDARLGVHQERMIAEALAGQEVRSSDIEWLRRKMPMTHEVLRPIREGERAHRNYPGCKFDIVPHPEAQARAEEIVTAWDAWWAERMAVHGRYVTEAMDDAANEAGDAAAALAYRLAELPAHTAAGLRVKLRALLHYNRTALLSAVPEEPDPDQALSHSLWRDAFGEAAATARSQDLKPDPILAAIAASRQAEAEMAKFARLVAGRPMTDASRAREEAIDAAQRATREKVWTTVPTSAAGLLSLAEYAKFQAGLAYGDNWRQEASKETFGDAFLALAAAIEANAGPASTASPSPITLTPDRAWAVEQAASVDLSGLTVVQLNILYDHFHMASEAWSEATNAPWADKAGLSRFRDLSAAGLIADREHNRAAEIRSRIVDAIRVEAPADNGDRDWRLEVLIRHELLCEGSLEHAPELRAEMAEAWGG